MKKEINPRLLAYYFRRIGYSMNSSYITVVGIQPEQALKDYYSKEEDIQAVNVWGEGSSRGEIFFHAEVFASERKTYYPRIYTDLWKLEDSQVYS